jgi:hypothetical protein
MRGTYRVASNRFGVSSVGHKKEKTKNEKGTLVVRYFFIVVDAFPRSTYRIASNRLGASSAGQ